MRAAALWPARREVGLVDHPEPALGSPHSVLVRTLEVGVCGTDAELCAFHMGATPPGSDYLVPGHEALGEVVEVGPAVAALRPGDLVVPSVRRPCARAHCPACRSGAQDYCVTGEFTERGLRGVHGFLTERFAEEEEFLYPVPAELREVAVLTEPLTIAEKALRQYLAVQRRLPWLTETDDEALLAGRHAVVLGAGPVGILGAMLLRSRGCEVWVYSREPASTPRAAIVEATGSRYLSAADVTLAELRGEAGEVALVYEAAGSSLLAFEMMGLLRRNAVMVITGVPRGGGAVPVPTDALMTDMVIHNAAVVGTVNAGREDFASATRDLEAFERAWPGAVRGIVTGRHGLDDFCACATARGPDAIKELIVL